MCSHTTETRPDPVALTREWFRDTVSRLGKRPELALSIANQLIREPRTELMSGKDVRYHYAELTNQALLPAQLAVDILNTACIGGFKVDATQHQAIVTEIHELAKQLQLLVMDAVDRQPEHDAVYHWGQLLPPLKALLEVVESASGVFRRLPEAKLSVPFNPALPQVFATSVASIYTRMAAIVEAQARVARKSAGVPEPTAATTGNG